MRWHEALGYGQKVVLIVHADDAGNSAGANHGIAECHSKGLVTSASVLVTGSHYDSFMADVAPAMVDVGLHLNLAGEEIRSPEKVRISLSDQLGFMSLTRHPTHLDSHGGVAFTSCEATREYLDFSTRNSIPALVAQSPAVRRRYPLFTAEGYGFPILDDVFLTPKLLSPEQKLEWACGTFAGLTPGIYEWIVHPHLDDEVLDVEGYGDVWVLTHPQLKRLLKRRRFVLTDWVDVWNRYLAM